MAAFLSTILMAGIMSTFLFLGRASVASGFYGEMEIDSRHAVEVFARDARMTADVSWTSQTAVVLTLQGATGRFNVTYTYYATATNGFPARSFVRTAGGSSTVLLTGVRNSFRFAAYDITGREIDLSAIGATTNAQTKQIQLALVMERSKVTTPLATDQVISARFVLRNKQVTA